MGWTPLMIAASVKDSEKLVDFLLSKGADPNEKSKDPAPVPMKAMYLNHHHKSTVTDTSLQTTQARQAKRKPGPLLSSASLPPSPFPNPPLSPAPNIPPILTTRAHAPHTPPQTVVHFVASKNNLDIARRLFANQPPASARVRDRRGQYALHRAAAVGSAPMVGLLLQNKSPLNATDSDGQTALHHAIAEGHGELGSSCLFWGSPPFDLMGSCFPPYFPPRPPRRTEPGHTAWVGRID